jgi:hypothetical protein
LSKIETRVAWGPDVVGRMRLDERRWAYGGRAPFDMPAHIPDLMGTKVSLDGKPFEIRGIVPKAPFTPIKKGELMELLVVVL